MHNLALSSWANVSAFFGDFLSLIILVGIIAAYGFYKGKERVTSFILALYAAALLYPLFPYAKSLTVSFGPVTSKFLLFVVMVVAFNFVFGKLVSPTYGTGKVRDWSELAILSVLAGAMIIVLLYHVLPFASIYKLTPAVSSLFAAPETTFFVLLAPIVAMFFVHRN